MRDYKPPEYASCSSAKTFLDTMDLDRAQRYEVYFDALRPATDEEVFRRALFAFASVHTTWQSNCALYSRLATLDWLQNRARLMVHLSESGAGLHNNRFKYLWEFAQKFWAHPQWYAKQTYEDWFEYRDRLDKNIKGLGLAKAAFFVELTRFHDSNVSCFDVHMLKLFGIPAKHYRTKGASAQFVRWCEQEWAVLCAERNVSPVTARWCYWDQKQNKLDSRYWSKVLEPNGFDSCGHAAQLLLFPMAELERITRTPETQKHRSKATQKRHR